jgi:hypothetical protein
MHVQAAEGCKIANRLQKRRESACTDCLGNLSDPRQFADAKTHKAAMERCPVFIRDAVELVETLL